LLNSSPIQGFALRMLVMLPAIVCAACGQPSQPKKPPAPTPQPAVSINPLQTPSPVTAKPLEMPSPVIGRPYPGAGVITIINRKEGWVEINHEEIKGLMPAMQMEFWLKNRTLVDKISVGDRVDFTVVETGKGEYITKLKKAPAVQ
jgi:Cu/Ag efflux protein CusF